MASTLSAASIAGLPSPADGLAARHGVTPEELTPAVRAALERLEAEAQRLRVQLSDMEQLADLDSLTPILNRRAFERELGRAMAGAQRYGEPLSLVYFDLNGFKAINDHYGHAAGDAALQRVAEILTAHVRTSDMVGRLGGDEFAAALTRASPEGAARRAAQLAALIEAEPVQWRERSFFLSVAHGVRAFEPGQSAAELLASADAAMYLRKRS